MAVAAMACGAEQRRGWHGGGGTGVTGGRSIRRWLVANSTGVDDAIVFCDGGHFAFVGLKENEALAGRRDAENKAAGFGAHDEIASESMTIERA